MRSKGLQVNQINTMRKAQIEQLELKVESLASHRKVLIDLEAEIDALELR